MNTGSFFRNESSSELIRYAALPLRLIVGYGLLAHGLAKWFKGPLAFAGVLQAAGVPASHLMAWTTIIVEVLSGIALLLGAFVSLVSIPAIILLVVAIVTVHLPYGFTSIKLLGYSGGRAQFGPPGYECDLLYIACIVSLVLTGPSPFSVDLFLKRRKCYSGVAPSKHIAKPTSPVEQKLLHGETDMTPCARSHRLRLFNVKR